MKKVLSILLSCLFLLFASTSCATKQKNITSDKLSIVTTIFPYYDFVKNIVGDKAEVTLLLSPGTEPHSYEPSPSDIINIENCDLFIYNGGESDEWVNDVLHSINGDVNSLKMTDCVDLLEEQSTSHSHNHNDEIHHKNEHIKDEDNDIEYDEHIWTSVRNAITICKTLAQKITALDSSNESFYSKNLNLYLDSLCKLDEEFSEIVENGKRNIIVFGDRFPFLYFTNDYSLEFECAFPGCNSETEPSISTVTHMIDFVRENDIPTVFYLEFSNGKIAQLICEDTGARALRFSSCHNITKNEFESGESYISLMQKNAKALKEALS